MDDDTWISINYEYKHGRGFDSGSRHSIVAAGGRRAPELVIPILDAGQADSSRRGGRETIKKSALSEGLLSSFSLYSTLGKLTAPGAADDIACIHGVRAAATVSLLVAHKFLAVGIMPYTNRLKMAEVCDSS
ncbi:unnamed protein product [Plutella xylostella]|uniref:(diamondback moth) hypothetical protein n=1 Tax=Plutella xylostella TaxID=51655 RepID=A0A8S4D333_PLUXY|nr:unnamed protein product [Plutella xylostella]